MPPAAPVTAALVPAQQQPVAVKTSVPVENKTPVFVFNNINPTVYLAAVILATTALRGFLLWLAYKSDEEAEKLEPDPDSEELEPEQELLGFGELTGRIPSWRECA
jgi:hypothetical protein